MKGVYVGSKSSFRQVDGTLFIIFNSIFSRLLVIFLVS